MMPGKIAAALIGLVTLVCVAIPAHAADPCTTNADCDDNDICTIDICNPGTNTCMHQAIAGCVACTGDADCDDNNPCTTDTCQGGQCTYQPIANCCQTDADCDDGDPCTSDTCNVNAGMCEYDAVPGCVQPDAAVGDGSVVGGDGAPPAGDGSVVGGDGGDSSVALADGATSGDGAVASGDGAAAGDAVSIPNDDDGCSCTSSGGAPSLASLLVLLVPLALRRRRK